jgi:hypothetical protein
MVDELYVERDSADISSDINKSFDELVLMSEKQFRAWAVSMREELAKRWQERRLPPGLGFTTENIESQFRVISRREVTDLLVIDELTGQRDCILADTKIGSACRAFFPGIAKTKDVAATSGKGYSQCYSPIQPSVRPSSEQRTVILNVMGSTRFHALWMGRGPAVIGLSYIRKTSLVAIRTAIFGWRQSAAHQSTNMQIALAESRGSDETRIFRVQY